MGCRKRHGKRSTSYSARGKTLQKNLIYNKQDLRLTKTLKVEKWENGCAVTPAHLVVVPYPLISLMNNLVKKEHNSVHWGTENLLKHLQISVISSNMVETIEASHQEV